MRAGASWSTSQHAEASWSTSQHAGASWSTSQHAEASWSTSQHAEASWSTSQHAEASWSTSQHAGASWSTSQHAEASWSTSQHTEASWSTSQHAPKQTSFQGGAMRIIRVTWGFTVTPSSWSAWTWSACPLARNQIFQHSTAVTFLFISTFLLLQEPINMLIATKRSGVWIAICQNDGRPADFSVTVLKKRSMTENIQLTRPLIYIYIYIYIYWYSPSLFK